MFFHGFSGISHNSNQLFESPGMIKKEICQKFEFATTASVDSYWVPVPPYRVCILCLCIWISSIVGLAASACLVL